MKINVANSYTNFYLQLMRIKSMADKFIRLNNKG